MFKRELTSGQLETRLARGRTSHLRDVTPGCCFMSEGSLGPRLQTTLEVTPPCQCMRGRRPGKDARPPHRRSRVPLGDESNAGPFSVSLPLSATRVSNGPQRSTARVAVNTRVYLCRGPGSGKRRRITRRPAHSTSCTFGLRRRSYRRTTHTSACATLLASLPTFTARSAKM